MFSNLSKTGLLGIPLSVLITAVALKGGLPGGQGAEIARRPGEAEPVAAAAAANPAAPVTLREFSGEAELADWAQRTVARFKEQDKTSPPIAPKLVPTSLWDCDDYSERIQRQALNDGYLVSMQLITKGTLLGAKVTNYVEDHMGNITIIGNWVYYIEPMDGHVALICPKD